MTKQPRQTGTPEKLSTFGVQYQELLAEIARHPKGSWERELAEQKLAQLMREQAKA